MASGSFCIALNHELNTDDKRMWKRRRRPTTAGKWKLKVKWDFNGLPLNSIFFMFACFLSLIMIYLFSPEWPTLTTRVVDMFACVIGVAWTKQFPITIFPCTLHQAEAVPYIHRDTVHTHTHTQKGTHTLQPLTSIADLKIPPESQQASSSHIRAADIMPAASATTLCNRYTAYIKTYSINNPRPYGRPSEKQQLLPPICNKHAQPQGTHLTLTLGLYGPVIPLGSFMSTKATASSTKRVALNNVLCCVFFLLL